MNGNSDMNAVFSSKLYEQDMVVVGGGGGNREHTFVHLTQHVPVPLLPKRGPAKLVS